MEDLKTMEDKLQSMKEASEISNLVSVARNAVVVREELAPLSESKEVYLVESHSESGMIEIKKQTPDTTETLLVLPSAICIYLSQIIQSMSDLNLRELAQATSFYEQKVGQAKAMEEAKAKKEDAPEEETEA
jgi:hypothetical protein